MRGNVDALGRVAEEAIPKHAEHSAAGRTDEATHELRKLAVIDAKVDQYRAEAERCLEEPRVSPPPRPRPRQASGPDPTDTPAYYALDGMGWESAWGRQLAEITPLDASE